MSNSDWLKFAVEFFGFNFYGNVSPFSEGCDAGLEQKSSCCLVSPSVPATFLSRRPQLLNSSDWAEHICVFPEFLRRWKCQDQVMTPVSLIFSSFKCSGTKSHFSLLSVPGAVFKWGFCSPWVCCFPLRSSNMFFTHFPAGFLSQLLNVTVREIDFFWRSSEFLGSCRKNTIYH